MIKFFRQIRYKLMSENKTSKYFKYAIGEIVLVVVGILIALWINNWNENRKAKSNEKVLLEKLQVENQYNLNTLMDDTLYRKVVPKVYDSFMEYLSSSDYGSTIDSLEYYLSNTLKTTTYTFSQNNLLNFTNNQYNLYSNLNKEITQLENKQNDLYLLSEKLSDFKVENYFKALGNDIDFYTGEIYSTDNITSVAFRNNLLIINSSELEVSKKFFEALEQMKKVDSMITDYLKSD